MLLTRPAGRTAKFPPLGTSPRSPGDIAHSVPLHEWAPVQAEPNGTNACSLRVRSRVKTREGEVIPGGLRRARSVRVVTAYLPPPSTFRSHGVGSEESRVMLPLSVAGILTP